MNTLEFEALAEEEFEEGEAGLGAMEGMDSGLDLLGEDGNAMDDIEAKIELE